MPHIRDQVPIVLDIPPGMALDAAQTMRRAVFAALVAVLGACPSSQNPNQGGGPDAGSDSGGDAGTCTAIPTCSITIHYAGTGTNVSLRGDFAPDGWTTGIAMTPSPMGGFDAIVPIVDEQIVVYKFVVDGQWMADPANPRKSPDGYGAFNSVTRGDCDHCPHRAAIDWRDAVMYFAMVDRFADGDPSNNTPVPNAEYPGQYQGGDFKGIQQKIEAGYFDQLGINTIWITSPLDNADNAYVGADGHMYSGYHGYWPKDETLIESRFGTLADLDAIVASAHAHGIQIVMDYVMNHVSSESPVWQQHMDWFNPDSNGSGGNCVCGQGCSWDTDRLVCWFDTFLPDFNFLNSAARKWSVDNAILWAKHVDGFRLDAVKHIQTVWLTDLRARVLGEVVWDQPFYMVGETFDGNRDLIKSYVDPNTMLDGQFDFPLRGSVLSTILHRSGSMMDLAGFVQSNDTYYGTGSIMSTFLGNHDVPRAIEHALDQPLFDPWDGGKSLAWSGQPQLPTTSSPFQRLQVAYAFTFTSPGVPMLYYGDEYGMAGAGDPDNRRFMQWSNYTGDQQWLHDQIATLAKIRNAHPATRRGTRTQLGVTNDAWVYRMSGAGDTVFVALNRSDSAQAAPGLPAGTYTDLISGQQVTAPLQIPPRTGMVLAP
jgi:glycosidase